MAKMILNGTGYYTTDENAVHTTNGTVDTNDIQTIPNSVHIGGNYLSTHGYIWAGTDVSAQAGFYAREGSDLIFRPAENSQDTGDIIYYYHKNLNNEKARIYTSNSLTNVNDAAPKYRAYKSDGSLIMDTSLLTKANITAISNSVTWKPTTTSFSKVSDLSFSVPAYSIAIVTAQQLSINAVPRSIGIGTGTSSNLVALNTSTAESTSAEYGGCHITTTATIINSSSSAVTYNIYCGSKTASSNGNTVRYKGIIIPYTP